MSTETLQDAALLTNSDYEHLMEDLGSDSFSGYKLSPLAGQSYSSVEVLDEPVEKIFTTPTIDVPPQSLSATCAIPSKDVFPGPFSFEVRLDSTSPNKRSWVYSTVLNKVFIDMFRSLLVQFHVNENISGLHVRALPVYSLDDSISKPVQRCTVHALSDDKLQKAHSEDKRICYCANFNLVGHVLRSNHPLAMHEYDADSERHSVLVPLEAPQAGSDIVVVEYHFSCKTSCPQGMNRKPIDVIFTLETEQGEVIGRNIIPVKICSCPKRDKEKEERDAAKEERSSAANVRDNPKPSSTGKRMASSSEKQDYNKRIKIENTTSQQNKKAGNESPVDANNQTNVDMVKAQYTYEISELRNMLFQHTEQIAQQRIEIADLSSKLTTIMSQQADQSYQIAGVDQKLEALFHFFAHARNN